MKAAKHNWLYIILTGMLALFVLAGCASGAGDDAAPPDSAPAQEQPAAEVPAEEPVSFTTYNINGAYLVDVPDGLEVVTEDDNDKITVIGDGWKIVFDASTVVSPLLTVPYLNAMEENGNAHAIENRFVGTFDSYSFFPVDPAEETPEKWYILFDTTEDIYKVQLSIITLEAPSDVRPYVDDPVVNWMLDSIRETDEAVADESGIMSVYTMESMTIEAPSAWFEMLNDVQFGTEVLRVASVMDWQDDRDAKVITVSYLAEGDDDIAIMIRSLELSYSDLVEGDPVMIDAKAWRYFIAAHNMQGESVVYSAFFGMVGERHVLIDFTGILHDDPLVKSVLSSARPR